MKNSIKSILYLIIFLFISTNEAQSQESNNNESANIIEHSRKLHDLQKRTETWLVNTAEGRNDFINLAKHLDKDPKKILAWINDNIGISYYKGALRGPIGTIVARRANGVDQTLLAGILLQQSGYNVRYSRGVIDTKLLDKYEVEIREFLKVPTPKGSTNKSYEEAIKIISEKTGISIETILKARKASELETNKRMVNLISEVSQQTDTLNSLMQGAWSNEEAKSNRLHLLTDHLWLEYELDGVWKNMNPMMSLLSQEASKNLKPDGIEVFDTDKLPADLFSTIRIEIKANVRETDTDALQTLSLVSHTFKTASAKDQSIKISFSYEDLVESDLQSYQKSLIEVAEGENPDKVAQFLFKKNAKSISAWTPVISFGDLSVAEYTINPQGQVEKKFSGKPGPIRSMKFGAKFNDAIGALENLGSKPKLNEKAINSKLESVYMEISVKNQSSKEKVYTRTFFDLSETNDKSPLEEQYVRAAGLANQSEIFVQTGIISDNYFMTYLNQIQYEWLENIDRFSKLKDADTKGLDETYAFIANYKHLHLRQLAHERGALSNQMNLDIDIAQPQIFCSTLGLNWDNKLTGYHLTDIIENTVTSQTPIQSLTMGVIDTVLEWKITEHDKGTKLNAALSLSTDLNNGDDWVQIESVEQLVQFPSRSIIEIQKQIDEGFAVFIPTSLKQKVWWSIHKESGVSLGYIGDGRGGSATEYKSVTWILTTQKLNLFTIFMLGYAANGCTEALLQHGYKSCEALVSCVGGVALSVGGFGVGALAAKAVQLGVMGTLAEGIFAIGYEVRAYQVGNSLIETCKEATKN